jgi:hypothetical protein
MSDLNELSIKRIEELKTHTKDLMETITRCNEKIEEAVLVLSSRNFTSYLNIIMDLNEQLIALEEDGVI